MSCEDFSVEDWEATRSIVHLSFADFQRACKHTAIYPEAMGLYYVALGLASEAGEVCGKIKKIMRDCGGSIDPKVRAALAGEIGDVLWYASQLCSELGLSLEDVAEGNLEKLFDRQARGVLGGSGDQR